MRCSNCGWETTSRPMQCAKCKRVGTLRGAVPLAEVHAPRRERIETGIGELDDLLGGGLVPGKLYRLSGEPGCGKSTLALDVATRVTALYATAEEELAGLRERADRLGRSACESLSVSEVRAAEDVRPLVSDSDELVVVDSLNELASPHVGGAAGSNAQLLHAIAVLRELARDRGVAVLMISWINGDGVAAGTRGAAHRVDGILEMEAEDAELPGVLTVRKHRYGPAGRSIYYRHHKEGLTYATQSEEDDHPHPLAAPFGRRDDAEEEEPEEEGDEEAEDEEEARPAQPPRPVQAATVGRRGPRRAAVGG